MSKTAIIKTGEQFFIKQLSKSQPIKLDKVIFANINGINGDTEIDLSGPMPDNSQIVHTAPITQCGLLNDKTVVYSVILDTSVGDFSFNYIGLANSETNTLCMIMHTDLTKKIKTAGQRQGNTITESIWLEIDNASESTGITVNAETWQIDYSKRLAGEDERIRLTNYDLYDRIVIHRGFTITKNNNQLTVSPGLAYVAGLRVEHATQATIKVENNQSLYIDAWLSGTATGEWSVNYNLIAGTNLRDYEKNGFKHYIERIASVDASGKLIVVKPKMFITTYDQATTQKTGIVKLSSSTNSTSEADAATPLAVKKVNDLAVGAVRRSGDNMSGDLFVKNKRVLLDGEAYPFRGRLSNTHLNNIKGLQHGVYYQPANELATFANGYPINSAGALTVTQTGGDGANGCVQTYTDYYSGRQFVRTFRDIPNVWMSWIEQITTANGNFILPVGVPLPWSLPVPPEGWFNCNGSPFDKTRCPKLAFAYPSGYLPDLRGEFIRGWDDSRGVDRYRGLLSWQGHQVAAHRHVGGWGENFSSLNAENRQRVAPFGCTGEGGHWVGATSNDNDNPLFYTNDGTNGSINNPRGVTSWFNLNADGLVGHETRPRNIAFNYIVKAE